MAMLVTAAHTHHSEANPSTVSQIRTTTAIRLATPNDRIHRSLAVSSAPQVATTYSVLIAAPAGIPST